MLANPFRLRYTEQLRDPSAFLRSFGAEMLDVLPDQDVLWNQLVVLRSAPGAGKTSLLRVLTPESLRGVIDGASRDESIRGLRDELSARGVIVDDRAARLGVLVGVSRDYKSLVDLGPKGAAGQKVFLKLLDARILARTLEAVLASAGLSYPSDVDRVEIRLEEGEGADAAREAMTQILGQEDYSNNAVSGDLLLGITRAAERGVLSRLDSLVPVDWDAERGHSRLYSLALLSNASFAVDGDTLESSIVLMFDDVHELTSDQREQLYGQLLDRETRVSRWIAERKEAVGDAELLTGHTEGREYRVVWLEDALSTGLKGGRSSRIERFLSNIANTRSFGPLSSLAITESYTELLAPDQDGERLLTVLDELTKRVEALVDEYPRFSGWFQGAMERDREQNVLAEATRWREWEILLRRQIARSTHTLFDFEEEPVESMDRLGSSASFAAARLLLSKEYSLPYYYGPSTLADLSSRNVEQYLGLAGDLFDLMSTSVALRRGAQLSAYDQDMRVRRTSRELWDAVVRRVPFGDDVRALLELIAERSREETFRPTAPYAPGVTGLALPENERAFIAGRVSSSSSQERLTRALGSAVANNLIEMSSVPISTKGQRWIVLNLNRLLCPHYGLPLQRGGWRETNGNTLAGQLEASQSARNTPAPGRTSASTLSGLN